MAKPINSLNDVVGHKNIVRYLSNHVEKDTVPNVIILHGNAGLGKTSIAKILAVEINSNSGISSVDKDALINSVIINNQSTDCIKLFNMSNMEGDSEIQGVIEELNIGFSSTGRKVLILDECHGMSKKAQDSILVELENISKNVYVFLCTTEIGVLRESLLSRCKAPLRMNDLTNGEMRRLLKDAISHQGISFDLSLEMVLSLLTDYTKNQPRRALNLIESFSAGSVVTASDLEVFIDLNAVSVVIQLFDYLYKSIALGIEFLESVKFDSMFATSLIEVTKIALGHTSTFVSKADTMYIRDFIKGKDVKHIIKFTADVTGLESITKRRVISAFIRNHVSYETVTGTSKSISYEQHDIKILTDTVGNDSPALNLGYSDTKDVKVQSLAELMSNSSDIK